MKSAIVQKFRNLKVHKRGDKRSPHKPLLALWAIGQCIQGRNRLIKYDEIEKELTKLLKKYSTKPYRPYYPFWRMKSDEVWELANTDKVEEKNGDVSPADLRLNDVRGGFSADIFNEFRCNVKFAWQIAQILLDCHFPITWHSAIMSDTLGYNFSRIETADSPFLESVIKRRKRDSKFREMILGNFGFKCAVCRYSIEFPTGYWPALEAAHIKWHSHKGPDTLQNGLSLCVLHHELFDWGIFTIQPNSLKIKVAAKLLRQFTENKITDLDGSQLPVIPKENSHRPEPEYLNWHSINVFRGN